MPSNKNQHYVPIFHLTHFSNDGKSIKLFNLKSEKTISGASLRDQCSKDYLYGKDLTIEKALGQLEGRIAEIIKETSMLENLPSRYSREHENLVYYVLTLYGRTLHMADAYNEIIDNLAKYMITPALKSRGLEEADLDGIKVKSKKPAAIALSYITLNYHLLLDLDFKLLKNCTDEQFIISDNPVVLYNQLFNFKLFGSNSGLACKGLQIFCPISPNHMLIFFDEAVYKVSTRKKVVVEITNINDIRQLNALQLVSANKNVYFKDMPETLRQQHIKCGKYYRKNKASIKSFLNFEEADRKNEYICIYREDVRTNLDVSVIRFLKKAKEWRNNFLKLPYRPAVVVRDEYLVLKHQEYIELVKSGKVEINGFFRWLKSQNANEFL